MHELSEPLPSERRRRKALAAEEAVTGPQWHENPSDVACRKILRIFYASTDQPSIVADEVKRIREVNSAQGWPAEDIERTLVGPFPDPEDRLDCIATISLVLGRLGDELNGNIYWGSDQKTKHTYRFDAGLFRSLTDDVLFQHRVEWAFRGEHLVERGNQELHASVVRPATELLGGEPRFASVQRAYDKALLELSQNDPGDSITDANTALQEAFRVLGVNGSSASEQALKAERKGLLVGYDRKLVDGIVKLTDWVNAERSNNGDAHSDGSRALKADAWLVVHIVGALILRLFGENSRGQMPTDADSATRSDRASGGSASGAVG